MKDDINTALANFAIKVLESKDLVIDYHNGIYRVSPTPYVDDYVITIAKDDYHSIVFLDDIDAFDYLGMSDNEIDKMKGYITSYDYFLVNNELYARIESAIIVHEMR